MEKKIRLIFTGGTIAGESSRKEISETQSAEDFQRIIQPSLKKFENESGTKLSIEVFELCRIDSSNILPKHWMEIGDKIYDEYDNYDAFLITHGTNTLGYTSAALSFSFENLGKPVILTGSQIPLGHSGSDALLNLENAIRVAAGNAPLPIIGISVVFGSHIITGVRAKKTTEFDYDAFQSYTSSSLGRIGRDITINQSNLEKHVSYLKKNYEPALKKENLRFLNKFDTRIVSLTEFPGMSPDIFKGLVESNNIKGFILRAFGAGDASSNLNEGFQYLKDKKIPIVVTSQAPNGLSNFLVNKPGQFLLDNKLAIPSWDMNIESQTTKLSWLLGQKFPYEEISKKMLEDFKGEVNVKS